MTMMKIIKDKDKDNNVLHMKMIIKWEVEEGDAE